MEKQLFERFAASLRQQRSNLLGWLQEAPGEKKAVRLGPMAEGSVDDDLSVLDKAIQKALFAEPALALGEWRLRLQRLHAELLHEAGERRSALERTTSPLTRSRLKLDSRGPLRPRSAAGGPAGAARARCGRSRARDAPRARDTAAGDAGTRLLLRQRAS